MSLNHAFLSLTLILSLGCAQTQTEEINAQFSASALTDSAPQETTPTPTAVDSQDESDSSLNDDYDNDGFRIEDGDCDDWNADIHPDAPERCGDNQDNNCDRFVDEPSAIDARPYYHDEDGDGFGNPALYLVGCYPHTDFVESGEDCNDDDPLVYPGAEEYKDDTIDYNCDGQIGSE